MQDRAESELGLRLKQDRAESELELRLQQDRAERGHAPANFAFVTVLTSSFACSLSVSTDGLRLPLL